MRHKNGRSKKVVPVVKRTPITLTEARLVNPPVPASQAVGVALWDAFQQGFTMTGLQKVASTIEQQAIDGDFKSQKLLTELFRPQTASAPSVVSQNVLVHQPGLPDRNAVTVERRADAVRLLASQGPCHTEVVARAMGMDVPTCHRLLTHRWFADSDDGWRVTPDGRTDVL